MRILGLLVAGNEASRYLASCLDWHAPICDGIVMYDDRSTDGSVELARARDITVVTRPTDVPAFLEHEGRCRQAALEALRVLEPAVGDWVFSFDADEFLVGPAGVRLVLEDELRLAQARGAHSLEVHIPEIFHVESGEAFARVDGWWDRINGVRFYAWRPDLKIADRALACGSAPQGLGIPQVAKVIELLHYGYADAADRQEKWQRYSNRPGHSAQHVSTIRQLPTLRRYSGITPGAWRAS